MNYQAFTSDSLTMMYEGVRGALAVDDALKNRARKLGSVSAKHLSGKSTRPPSKPKCSSGECSSRSSIGRKIQARLPLRNANDSAPFFLNPTGRQHWRAMPTAARVCDQLAAGEAIIQGISGIGGQS